MEADPSNDVDMGVEQLSIHPPPSPSILGNITDDITMEEEIQLLHLGDDDIIPATPPSPPTTSKPH